MFQLLVKISDWGDGHDRAMSSRTFEFTDPELAKIFKPGEQLDQPKIKSIPAIFACETGGQGSRLAKVGSITSIRHTGKDIAIEFAYDTSIAPIDIDELVRMAPQLDIIPSEFSRTHWAIKDIDLYKILMRSRPKNRQRPRIFSLVDPEAINRDLVSVMMPYGAAFDPVYKAIQTGVQDAGKHCKRGDDIWDHASIIQDVVSLIDRSGVVICDCTGKNANVFYEAGIAHTLGREIILITQADVDIPFNIGHLRYLKYLNNNQGLSKLSVDLCAKLETY